MVSNVLMVNVVMLSFNFFSVWFMTVFLSWALPPCLAV